MLSNSASFGSSDKFTASDYLSMSYTFSSSDILMQADSGAGVSTKSQGGVIAGVVGGICAICVLCVLLWLFVFRKRPRSGEAEQAPEAELDAVSFDSNSDAMLSNDELNALCATSALSMTTQENAFMTAFVADNGDFFEEGMPIDHIFE